MIVNSKQLDFFSELKSDSKSVKLVTKHMNKKLQDASIDYEIFSLPNNEDVYITKGSNSYFVKIIPQPKPIEKEVKVEISLKWGGIKSSYITTEEGNALLDEYNKVSDTDRDKEIEIICKLIDLCDEDKIYLHWDGVYTSKEEAKEYVRNYNK